MKGLVLVLSLLISNLFAYEMQLVNTSINFDDDLDFKNLNLAIERQLRSYQSQNMDKVVKMGADTFTKADMQKSLLFFQKVVQKAMECLEQDLRETCYANFNLVLNQNFKIYKPVPLEWEAGHGINQTQFTAYYSPDLHGKTKPDSIYKNPIYAMPSDPKLRGLTREEIDFDKKLAGYGLELVFVKESLYDIWLLHVEGGGRVQVENEDGTVKMKYLSYHSSNKQPFNFLSRYMLAQGMIQPGAASVYHQRKYIVENPHRAREIFASSPSYIYFKFTDDEPLGVRNIPLTENRSLATDYRIYNDYGFINFVKAKRPIRQGDGRLKFIPFSRFYLNQDTGGAIKGQARCDLYFGFGSEAQTAANNLKLLGDQYFLMLDPTHL